MYTLINEVIQMDNNKNRLHDRPKSNAELRKIYPKDNSDLGIIDGKKIGAPIWKEKDHL
jgi:hypothetical protein